MWNKKTEAQDYVAVNNIENFDGIEKKDGMETNMEQFYESYKKQNSNPKRRLSKRYFEKIAREIIDKHVDEYGVISSSWWK